MHRIGLRLGFLALCSLPAQAAGLEGLPLNDYTRLGQRFTATLPLSGVWIIAPSWLDAEGGFTLTLWDSPQRRQPLAQQTFTDIPDNARLELWLPKPVPPGIYYWEIDRRTGQTQVGLYVETLEAETEDCAYLDGQPDRKRRFSFGPLYYAGFRYTDTEQMVAALQSDAPLEDKFAACRQLAVVGGREAVPVLAGLLQDERLSTMARHALEAMPDPAAGEALRQALGQLSGKLRIGVINSVGVRRDSQAVPALARLLRGPDLEAAAAAAMALGKIGTRSAARALERAMERAPAALRPALREGLLECADRLAAQGQREQARSIYDRLRDPRNPPAVRAAALRGAVLARPPQDLPLLMAQLHGPDMATAEAALWMVARELPGAAVTRALAAELDRLPPARQAPLGRALGHRGDPAALPALLGLLKRGEKSVRLAVLEALPQLVGEAAETAPVVSALTEALADPDEDLSRAAQRSLERLPGAAVEAAAATLLTSPAFGELSRAAKGRLAGVQLLRQRQGAKALSLLLQAARDADPEVRTAALKGLEEQAGPAEIPALLDLLVQAQTPDDLEGAEAALAAACARTDSPDSCAEPLIALLETAEPPLKRALLRLLQGLGGTLARQAVRAAVGDPDAEVRSTALRLLGEWKTADVAPDLLELARNLPDPADRLLCLRSYLRLAGHPELPVDQRLAICQQAAALIQREEEKKLLLGMLGTLPTPEALALARPYLDEPATREEASAAVVAIAEALIQGHQTASLLEPLQKVAGSTADPDLAQRAEALVKKLQSPSP